MSISFLKAVLNVQSNKITLLLTKKDGAILRVMYKKECVYDGFSDGQFFDAKALRTLVAELIADAEVALNVKIKKLLVGAPGEFTPVVNKQFEKVYSKIRKLTASDIEKIHREGDTFTGIGGYTAINVSPVFYMKGQIKLQNPVGIVTNKLTANVSYVLLESYFKDLFDDIGRLLKLRVSYCSTVLAEGVYLIPYEVSDNGAILVDSDFTSTSVSYFSGSGILSSTTFELGTAHILNAILDNWDNKIPYRHAEEILKKANLNVNADAKSVYTVNDAGESYSYSMLDVNEIAYEVIKCIATQISKAMSSMQANIAPSSPIIFTGDGIANIIGAKELVETITGRTVICVTPSLVELADTKYSSLVGLMCYSLYAEHNSIFEKLFSFLHIGG